MTIILNLTDVPLVETNDLGRIMSKLVDAGHGLVMLEGLTPEKRKQLEDAIWQTYHDQPERRLAVLMRLQCLVEVFASRRLRDLLLAHGFALIRPALTVAACQRLNTAWGFNPQKFLTALGDHLKAAPKAPARRPHVEALALAA